MNSLNDVTLLQGLNGTQLAELESIGEHRTYKKGSIILGKEDTTDYLYILMSGHVDAYVDEGGKRIVVNTIEQGESFGELAMLSDEPRSAFMPLRPSCRRSPMASASHHAASRIVMCRH